MLVHRYASTWIKDGSAAAPEMNLSLESKNRGIICPTKKDCCPPMFFTNDVYFKWHFMKHS